jgi:hypothetical protein
MQLYNKYIATFLVCVLWFFTGLVMRSYGINPEYNLHFVVTFAFASLITFAIFSFYRRESEQEARQRKVERFVRDLKPDDLAMLRERLTYENGADGEYESLEDLLDQQKQKRG